MTKTNKPGISGAELARELGVSENTVSKKRSAGKTDDEIRQEAKLYQGKDESFKSAHHLMTESKARKAAADAELAELELAEARGELVSMADVNNWVAGMILRARDILVRIGPELCDRISQESDPIKVRSVIETEVTRALRELAKYKQ
jgi:phage terminase Nu1 subunit (DNA packaging protein)